MLKPSNRYTHYVSAKDRFFKPAIVNFFTREFPSLFGPVTRENIAGELIANLVDGVQAAGYQEVTLNGSELASGVYLYRINAVSLSGGKSFSATKKMVLMK